MFKCYSCFTRNGSICAGSSEACVVHVLRRSVRHMLSFCVRHTMKESCVLFDNSITDVVGFFRVNFIASWSGILNSSAINQSPLIAVILLTKGHRFACVFILFAVWGQIDQRNGTVPLMATSLVVPHYYLSFLISCSAMWFCGVINRKPFSIG